MSVNLHLLKPEATERSQSDAFQQSLERNLDDPGQDRDSRKLDPRKDLNFFVEHFLDVGGETGVQLGCCGE